MGDSNPNATSEAGKNPVLKQAELDYMKIIEQKNRERVVRLQNLSKKNRITACCIGAGVFSIYMYSILAVRQETFLDDFNEPAKIQQ